MRPAYFCYGQGSWGGSEYASGAKNSRAFPAWLGKNSTQNRLRGALGEVQIRMRLKVSGDRNQIRQTYLPVLAPALAAPLVDHEAEGIPELIELMDEYYLTPEERDTIMELGMEDANGEALLKGVKSATKSSFTREYVFSSRPGFLIRYAYALCGCVLRFNKRTHPIPYHKASDLGKAPKKMAAGPAPDLDDVVEVSARLHVRAEHELTAVLTKVDEEVPDEDEGKEVEEDDDLSKDKLVKVRAGLPLCATQAELRCLFGCRTRRRSLRQKARQLTRQKRSRRNLAAKPSKDHSVRRPRSHSTAHRNAP